jgi:hypothetical protein
MLLAEYHVIHIPWWVYAATVVTTAAVILIVVSIANRSRR